MFPALLKSAEDIPVSQCPAVGQLEHCVLNIKATSTHQQFSSNNAQPAGRQVP
jgi:hypothetical protein